MRWLSFSYLEAANCRLGDYGNSMKLTPARLLQLKRDARRLKKRFSGIAHSEALDIIAMSHGFKDWRVLLAASRVEPAKEEGTDGVIQAGAEILLPGNHAEFVQGWKSRFEGYSGHRVINSLSHYGQLLRS